MRTTWSEKHYSRPLVEFLAVALAMTMVSTGGIPVRGIERCGVELVGIDNFQDDVCSFAKALLSVYSSRFLLAAKK
jgi:hypothetical protein